MPNSSGKQYFTCFIKVYGFFMARGTNIENTKCRIWLTLCFHISVFRCRNSLFVSPTDFDTLMFSIFCIKIKRQLKRLSKVLKFCTVYKSISIEFVYVESCGEWRVNVFGELR